MPLPKIRQELFGIFNQQWENAEGSLKSLGLSDGELEFYRDDSMLMLLNFSHWLHKKGVPAVDSSENRIWSKNLGLMGIIDAVLEMDSKLILVDYKTSKRAKITEDIRRQAALYALLYQDKYKTIPETVWIHFLKFPDDPLPVHIDDPLLEYGKIMIDSVRKETLSRDKKDYPCTCGGYCERDFIHEPKWSASMKS